MAMEPSNHRLRRSKSNPDNRRRRSFDADNQCDAQFLRHVTEIETRTRASWQHRTRIERESELQARSSLVIRVSSAQDKITNLKSRNKPEGYERWTAGLHCVGLCRDTSAEKQKKA